MKRKIAIILVSVALAISLMPVSAMAKESYTEGNFYYELGEGCIIITGYFGRDEEAVVPDSIAGYPVSEIAKGAFVDTNVKKLYLPRTIMEIKQGAIAEGIEVFYKAVPDSTGDNTETEGGAKTDGNAGETNINKKDYEPLVQPERDENGNVADGVNEGPIKVYVDDDGNLIEDPEEIAAIDAEQEAARLAALESSGAGTVWIIVGIILAVIAIAGVIYFIINRKKKIKKDNN